MGLTAEQEREVESEGTRFYHAKLREAGLVGMKVRELSDGQKTALGVVIGQTLEREARLRESATLSLNHLLAQDGIPMVDGPTPPVPVIVPEREYTSAELREGLEADGVPFMTGRDGLRWGLREAGQTSPENDAPSPVADANSARVGKNVSGRVGCPDCKFGLRDDGEPCASCSGRGYQLREAVREAGVVRALAERVIDRSPVPVNPEGPLGGRNGRLDEASNWQEADQSDAKMADGTVDLRAEGVPMSDPVPETTPAPDEVHAGLAAEGVPLVNAPRKTSAQMLAEGEAERAAEGVAA